MSRPPSICEGLGERLPQALLLRILCGAWLVPAASLIWIGLATTGFRYASDSSQALALGRTQAASLVLAVFTILVGASTFVRRGPSGSAENGPTVPGCRSWARSHFVAALVAMPLVMYGALFDSLTLPLIPMAGVLGFWAGLGLPRWLTRCSGGWAGPMAALSIGMVFQLSVGWLHVAHPTGMASPVLVMEGLLLAWAAASAARVDPFAEPLSAAVPVGATVTTLAAQPADFAPAGARLNPAPVQPSIPEAAVGR